MQKNAQQEFVIDLTHFDKQDWLSLQLNLHFLMIIIFSLPPVLVLRS